MSETNHPLHVHIYSMQIVSCGDDFEVGEYYDTVTKTTGDCIVCMDYVDITPEEESDSWVYYGLN